MDSREIHVLLAAGAFTGIFNGLFQPFLDALKVGVEIKGSPFLECHFQLHGWQRW
jgi:hypothetical protein